MKPKELNDLIDSIVTEEIKDTILKEAFEGKKQVYHIKCDGEPVESFDDEPTAREHLALYKKDHPGKQFIIERGVYESHSDMLEKLDAMGEQIEQNESNNMKTSPVKVKTLAEAILHAKENGIKKIRINEEIFDVDEAWDQMEEEEGCDDCDEVKEEEMSENDNFAASKWGVNHGKKSEEKGDGDNDKDDKKEEPKKEPKKGVDLGKSFEKFKKETKEEEECDECGGEEMNEAVCEKCGKEPCECVVKEETESVELSYVVNSDGHVKNISKSDEAANKFLNGSLKGNGSVKHKTVSKKDYDNGKVTVSNIKNYKSDVNESKNKNIRLTESQLINVISNMVKESSESIPGLAVTKKAQNGSKKENDQYASEVAKKMKDYNAFEGNDNPEFPKPIGKGEKMAVNNTKEEDEVVDDNRGRGMENLVYDNEPSKGFKERLKGSLEGDSKLGNAQETEKIGKDKTLSNGAKIGEPAKNVSGVPVKTDTGKKLNNLIPKKEKAKKEEPIYNKQAVPVKVVKEEEGIKFSSILEEELNKMNRILKYNNKTQ